MFVSSSLTHPKRLYLLIWLLAPIGYLVTIIFFLINLLVFWNQATPAQLALASDHTPRASVLGMNTQPQKVETGGLVTLWYDDAWRSQYLVAYEAMQKRNLYGTIAVPTMYIGSSHYMTWNQLQKVQYHGWEITAHGHSHDCKPEAFTEALLDLEVNQVKTTLSRYGLHATTYVLPCGAMDKNMTERIKQHYYGLRNSDGNMNLLPLEDPYYIKAITMTPHISQEEIANWLEKTKQHNGWLVFMFHQIDTSGSEYSVSPEQLENILDKVVSSGLQVVTPSQVVENPILNSQWLQTKQKFGL